MKRQWTDDELEAHFTLHSAELDLVGDSKTDHNLPGFAVLLKSFQFDILPMPKRAGDSSSRREGFLLQRGCPLPFRVKKSDLTRFCQN